MPCEYEDQVAAHAGQVLAQAAAVKATADGAHALALQAKQFADYVAQQCHLNTRAVKRTVKKRKAVKDKSYAIMACMLRYAEDMAKLTK